MTYFVRPLSHGLWGVFDHENSEEPIDVHSSFVDADRARAALEREPVTN